LRDDEINQIAIEERYFYMFPVYMSKKIGW